MRVPISRTLVFRGSLTRTRVSVTISKKLILTHWVEMKSLSSPRSCVTNGSAVGASDCWNVLATVGLS